MRSRAAQGGSSGLWRTIGLALVAVLLNAPACADCEEEFCNDTLDIHLEKATPWPHGNYDIDLTLDDEAVHCSIPIPFDPEELVDRCDDEPTGVGGQTGLELSVVGTLASPARVELTLSFEGQVLVTETLEPEYHDTPGWNRRCGPPCDHAVVQLPIP